jgi:uncharacterized protein YacL
MRKKKYLLLFFVILVLSVIIGYNYMYKDHRDISTEKVQFTKKAKELVDEYQTDVEATTTKYLDKIIEIEGRITDIESDNFTLNNAIVCYTDSITIQKIKIDGTLKVKGRSIGYDELLEYIKLDQLIIINN